MPIGKPTPEGDIVPGSRFSQQAGRLQVSAWNCPACGVKNEGRKPELGCAHCGSGDQGKSAGGSPVGPSKESRATVPATASSSWERVRPPQPANGGPQPTESIQSRVGAPAKIYRLIEYLVADPALVQDVLRRSLVGTLHFPWGQLTGTIVDTLDLTQEDRLRMARMQPGVWLGNPPTGTGPAIQRIPRTLMTNIDAVVINEFQRAAAAREAAAMEPPDTGPAFSEATRRFAQALYDLAESIEAGSGLRFIHTLALALSGVAQELQGNMEPEKFMPSEAALALANALLHLIPADWTGETDERPAT